MSQAPSILGGRRVLVVDDDADMRLLISTVIETIWDDMTVVEFDPMDESATPIFDWTHYDLLILDYQLGNGSGLDWLKQYRKVPEFPPTILITGAGNEDIAVKALKLGAEDYIRKGEGFRERLIGAIHEILETLQNTVEDRSDWAVYLRKVAERVMHTADAGMSAMFTIELDQFPDIKATQGIHVAAQILGIVHRLVQDKIKTDGAVVVSALKDDKAVSAFASGLDSVADAEGISQEICQQVRKVRFRAGDVELSGTSSVGVCVVDTRVLEAANLVARSEAACNTAKLRGGDQSYLGSLRGEIGEAVSTPETSTGGVWRKDEEVNAIITERRLRTHFEHVRRLGEVGEPLFYRAVPVISQSDGSILDGSDFARFLANAGRRTFLDRITFNQALIKLKDSHINPVGRVFMRLSGESVVVSAFWQWLEGKLQNTGMGRRFVFEVAYSDVQDNRVPGDTLNRLSKKTGCRFAYHGFADAQSMVTGAKGLPIDFFVVDLSVRLASQSCDKVGALVKIARSEKLRVVLNRVDDSHRFACAYQSGADLLQGGMTAQWAEVDLDESQQIRSPWS